MIAISNPFWRAHALYLGEVGRSTVSLPPKGRDIDIYADCQELDLCLIVFLRRAGVMPEEIRRMRVAQVKPRRRKDTKRFSLQFFNNSGSISRHTFSVITFSPAAFG